MIHAQCYVFSPPLIFEHTLLTFPVSPYRFDGLEWNGMEWNGMEWFGLDGWIGWMDWMDGCLVASLVS